MTIVTMAAIVQSHNTFRYIREISEHRKFQQFRVLSQNNSFVAHAVFNAVRSVDGCGNFLSCSNIYSGFVEHFHFHTPFGHMKLMQNVCKHIINETVNTTSNTIFGFGQRHIIRVYIAYPATCSMDNVYIPMVVHLLT